MDVRLLGGFAAFAASYLYYNKTVRDEEAARQLIARSERELELFESGVCRERSGLGRQRWVGVGLRML